MTCGVLLVWVLVSGCGGGDERDDLPVVLSFPKSLAVGFEHPTASPPGADDPDCKPSDEHPRPVVLVHGTFNNRASTWNALSPLLKNEGYCVFSLNFGAKRKGSAVGATESIDASARQLARFVEAVLRLTGAGKVDMVGYSQSGMMPRQYLRFHSGAAKVASLIGLAPSNHGTNAKYDQVLTPYDEQFLAAGPNVTNITLQDTCRLDRSDHLSMPFDSVALHHVTNALDPDDATPRVHPGIGG